MKLRTEAWRVTKFKFGGKRKKDRMWVHTPNNIALSIPMDQAHAWIRSVVGDESNQVACDYKTTLDITFRFHGVVPTQVYSTELPVAPTHVPHTRVDVVMDRIEVLKIEQVNDGNPE